MTRPIEAQRDLWATAKDVASLRGRHIRTVWRWMANGTVRTWHEPGGRVLVYLPDCMPSTDLPPMLRVSGRQRLP